MSRLTVIRFLTETDYPPFNFTGADGNPAGFNVDLARALCDEIKVTCTIQMRRFETLVDAITSNRGDAIIASHGGDAGRLRARLDFTDPYYRAPARFVSRRDAVMPEIRPEYLEGKKVGVIAGTSHEAYLKAMFTDAETAILSQRRRAAAGAAPRRGRFHLRRRDRAGVLDQRHRFGRMLRVLGRALCREPLFRRRHRHRRPQGQRLLRQSLNWALFRLWEKGRYTDLWLRYFPSVRFTRIPSFRGERSAIPDRNPGTCACVTYTRNDGTARLLHFAVEALVSAALESL